MKLDRGLRADIPYKKRDYFDSDSGSGAFVTSLLPRTFVYLALHLNLGHFGQGINGSKIHQLITNSMQHGGGYQYGHSPYARPNGHQAPNFSGSDMFAQNSKTPPYWGPELEMNYPFKFWRKDISIWALATDIDVTKQGPVVAGRLGGTARSLAREIPDNLLVNGMMIAAVPHTGLEVLMRGLARKFAPLGVETQFRSMTEFLGFRRDSRENIDEALARWELLRIRAEEQGTCIISPPGLSLILLVALGIPRTAWQHLLQPFDGQFPQQPQDLDTLLDQTAP